MNEPHLARILPHTAPLDGPPRALLVAMRRMAIHGLYDASASLLMFEHFGLHFRKPLVLMRALLMEVSQTTRQPIQIAPCCAPRAPQPWRCPPAPWRRARPCPGWMRSWTTPPPSAASPVRPAAASPHPVRGAG